MIINQPTPDLYEKQCIRFLLQGLNMITSSPFNDPSTEEYISEIEVKEEDYWQYHQGVLQNSVVLIFLSLENYLKMKICEVSPLLLIDESPRNWKTIASDKSFDKMYIRQFDDLVILYLELGLGKLSSSSIQKLLLLKDKRNQIIHGIPPETLTANYIFEIIYDYLSNLWNDSTWWVKFKDLLFNEPLFGSYDSDFEQCSVINYIDCMVKYLGKAKTGELFGINLKQRLYYCPYCHKSLNSDFDYYENMYALLRPNTSTSKKLYCIVCGETYDIKREKCNNADCKGNVIDQDNICLTCLSDNSE